MLTFFGYLLVIFAIVVTIVYPYLHKKWSESEKKSSYLNFISYLNFKVRAGLFLLVY